MMNGNCQQTRSEMLNEIRAVNFTVIELGLYLDINPDDKRALCLHNENANKLRMLTDNYQKMYGLMKDEKMQVLELKKCGKMKN